MSALPDPSRRVPVGYYGKLPTHGDFVHRGVRDEFLNSWDCWLQEVIAGSRARLGEVWLQAYLTSPIWRFVLPSGVIGGATWAGVLMPSVDRVGRYFPLTLIGEFDPGLSPLRLAQAAETWFAELERSALATLHADALDLDQLGSEIADSSSILPHLMCARERLAGHAEIGVWQQSITGTGSLCEGLADWVERSVPAEWKGPSLWWSAGSALVAPQWRLVDGLPDPAAYVSMIGDPSRASAAPALNGEGPVFDPSSTMVRESLPWPCWSSAAYSHAGHVRTENQDSWLSRDDIGLWAVADGMGGHRDGARASRAVIEQIAAECPDAACDLDARVGAVRRALTSANRSLRDQVCGVDGAPSGSTAVVMVSEGGRGAVLWAGDSRLYRLRDGLLQAMTTDHTADPQSGESAGAITRAVGGEPELELDELRFDIRAGDRFLLCSDGVHAELDSNRLGGLMRLPYEPAHIAGEIGRSVLDGGARDNLTAVVLYPDPAP